ncbi:hypothetical protein LCL97_18880 [Seohaeicola saemankumensis]|nr:hypothetical protein [Seohaeicola saemankumensis]MCA0872901.1 hypothetical protein [Seohaeicola saemankumensis]
MLVTLQGCDGELMFAEHQHSVRATGIVRSVDRDARRIKVQVYLREITLKVSEDIDVFDRIEVGDRIPFRYRYATTVQQLPDDADLEPLDTKLKLSGPTDNRPGNALVLVRRITAEFVDFDHRSKLTTFRRSDGSYAVFLASGTFQAFVAGLARGDRVELVIEEAIAVLLEPKQ